MVPFALFIALDERDGVSGAGEDHRRARLRGEGRAVRCRSPVDDVTAWCILAGWSPSLGRADPTTLSAAAIAFAATLVGGDLHDGVAKLGRTTLSSNRASNRGRLTMTPRS